MDGGARQQRRPAACLVGVDELHLRELPLALLRLAEHLHPRLRRRGEQPCDVAPAEVLS